MYCDKRLNAPAIALLGLVLSAHATAGGVTAEEQLRRSEALSGLKHQVEVLEQRVKIGELEAKLQETRAPTLDLAPAQPPSVHVQPPASAPAASGQPLGHGDGPVQIEVPVWRVLSIYGTPGALVADVTDGRSVLRVAPGDTVGEYRVTGIADQRVEVKPKSGAIRQWRVGGAP